tara:strand:+ start:141 stop:341 length:201 start_codon:yes stop_codon:yes gene_type:complete
MTFEHDIFTFEVEHEHRMLKIQMIDYTTEDGETIMLEDPIDMTYVVNNEVYNLAKDLIAEEYEEYN